MREIRQLRRTDLEAELGPGTELMMRRFFRSAAFPILIVIVLAFFAQRLISGPSSEHDARPTTQFVSQVKHNPSIDRVGHVRPEDNSLDVEQQDGKSYSTGYPTPTTRRPS